MTEKINIVSLIVDSPMIGEKVKIEIFENTNNRGNKEYVLEYEKSGVHENIVLFGCINLPSRKMNNLFKIIKKSLIPPVPEPEFWEDTSHYELSFFNASYKYLWTYPTPKGWEPLGKIADRLEKWSEEKLD